MLKGNAACCSTNIAILKRDSTSSHGMEAFIESQQDIRKTCFFFAIRIPSLKAKLIDFQQFSLKDCNSCWPIVKSASFQSASVFNSRSRLNFIHYTNFPASVRNNKNIGTKKQSGIQNRFGGLNLDHLHSFAMELWKSITAIANLCSHLRAGSMAGGGSPFRISWSLVFFTRGTKAENPWSLKT